MKFGHSMGVDDPEVGLENEGQDNQVSSLKLHLYRPMLPFQME